MAKRLILLLVLLTLFVAACGSSADEKPEEISNTSQPPATFVTVSVQEAYNNLNGAENESAVIVDVRNPEEWAATGYPRGAQLIPLGTFQQRAPNELPKDAPIYVICNSGNRSLVASQNLIDLGFADVYNVDGGIQAWLQAGLPTEPYTP